MRNYIILLLVIPWHTSIICMDRDLWKWRIQREKEFSKWLEEYYQKSYNEEIQRKKKEEIRNNYDKYSHKKINK